MSHFLAPATSTSGSRNFLGTYALHLYKDLPFSNLDFSVRAVFSDIYLLGNIILQAILYNSCMLTQVIDFHLYLVYQ